MSSLPVVVYLGVCLTFLLVAWLCGCLVVCMQLRSAVLWCVDLMLMSTWHVAVLAALFACSVMLFALIVSNFFMRRFGSVYRRSLSVGSPLCPRNVVIIPPCYLSWFLRPCVCGLPVCPCARVSVCPWIPRVPVCPWIPRVPVCPEGREESNLQYAIIIHMIYYIPIKFLLLKRYEIPRVLRVF